MRTLKIYKEHLHALLYSIKKGSINHFFFKLSSFMRKRFREDPSYNQLTKIKKRTSKVTHWSEIEDPKPKLSKVSIALPSQIMNIEEDIDLNTLNHAKVNHQDFSIEEFNDFLQQVSIYENLKKESEKLYLIKKYEESSMIGKQADTLNETYDKELQVWINSRKSGGNNPSGMRKRYGIIKNRCL